MDWIEELLTTPIDRYTKDIYRVKCKMCNDYIWFFFDKLDGETYSRPLIRVQHGDDPDNAVDFSGDEDKSGRIREVVRLLIDLHE